MEIEYAIKGGFAYVFTTAERETIIKALQKTLPSYDVKIQRILNDPKNEGQATYSCKIDELVREKKWIQEMIKELK